MGFESIYYIYQDIIWKTCCSSWLLMSHWQSLLVCFGSLSCMSTNLWDTSCIPDGITWCCNMLWSPVWFNLTFTWCKSLTLQLAKAPYTITEPLPCFTVGMIQRIVALSQLFTAHRCSYLNQRFRTLIRQSKGLNSTVLLSILCVPWSTGAFEIVLLLQQWFFYSNSAI